MSVMSILQRGLKRFRKAVRQVIMARRFQAAAGKVGITITNGG
jgi:hypothetical protein